MYIGIEDSYAVITSDTGEKVAFDIKQYNTTGTTIGDDLFVEINAIFDLLKDDDRKEIFNLYKDIHEYIRLASRSDAIEMQLRERVGEIYEYLPWDFIYGWVKANRKIIYPDNLRESHDAHDQVKDKTYLRSDYFKLAVYAIWLRPMIPIWGQYIDLVFSESGAARKEYVAFRLLANTHVIYSPVLERLSAFVESMDGYEGLDRISTVAITGSLSSAETLQWILYTTVIRRVSCGQINADEPRGHLVSSVYNYLQQTINIYEKKFGNTIKPKNDGGNAEDDKPVIDRIRSAQRESLGDMSIYPVYLENRRFVVEDIEPSITDEQFNLLEPTVFNKVESFQKYICQFILSLVMSPLGIDLMVARRTMNGLSHADRNYIQVVHNPMHDALAICRVVLWYWGFKELSLLLTARRYVGDDLNMGDGVERINKNTVEKLMEAYPHSINKQANDRQRNVPYVAVTSIVKNIGLSSWDVDYPKELSDEVSEFLDAGGRMVVPSNIAEQLTELLLKIVDIKKSNYQASGGGKC